MFHTKFLKLFVLAFLLEIPHLAMSDESSDFNLGKKLFSSAVPPCGICHTLKDAGSEGAIGPILDELKPNQTRVMTALNNGIGAMPSFKEKLSVEEIKAIAIYVSKASSSN